MAGFRLTLAGNATKTKAYAVRMAMRAPAAIEMNVVLFKPSQRPAAFGAPPEPSRRDIAGVPVAAMTRDEALALIEHAFDGGRHLHLAYCNANLVNIAARDAALRERLAGFLILPDGIGVDIASRLLYGAPFPANGSLAPSSRTAAPAGRAVGSRGPGAGAGPVGVAAGRRGDLVCRPRR